MSTHKHNSVGKLYLPALRCKMGDRLYVATAFTFREVAERVKRTDEIHHSPKLADWIQRVLDEHHAARIAKYLKVEESRLFSALVLGVYGGNPEWAELSISDPRDELDESDEDRMNRTIGVLVLTGKEKLFAIDGQHRVAGIKRAIEEESSLADEEVAVLIIGHDNKTSAGKTRTRRLFVTLNQTAKKVSDRDYVALSEDNGLAVVTRNIVDNFALLQEFIAFSGTASINDSDKSSLTSILGLFQIIKGLYPRKHESWPKYTLVTRARPDEDVLDEVYSFVVKYWELLAETVPEYRAVLVTHTREAGHYRSARHNHLLFRPAGQLAFARATEYLMTRHEVEMENAIKLLLRKTTTKLSDSIWHEILWNPREEKMLTNWSVAETVLLQNAGLGVRSQKSLQKLKRIRAG